jgi:hypothetical protein
LNIINKLLSYIDANTRISTIFYSLVATAVWTYSPTVLSWLGNSSLSYFTNFIDSRYAKAATLEASNYSYFIVLIIFVGLAIGWFEVSGKIRKNLTQNNKSNSINKNDDTLPPPKMGIRCI